MLTLGVSRRAGAALLASTRKVAERITAPGLNADMLRAHRSLQPGGPEGDWCETGHSIFILAGRIRYRFDTHEVEAGPGDMLHIPAGPEHRHIPSVVLD